MIIDISKIRREKGRTEEFVFTPDQEAVKALDPEFPGITLAALPRVEVRAANTGPSIDVRVRISAEFTGPCFRCLEDASKAVDIDYVEEYRRRTGEAPEGADGAEGEDGETSEVAYFEGDTIDLTEGVRANLVLGAPTRVLCKKTCRGLCPQCGINKNAAICQCDTRPVDPRLAKLAKLLEE